MALDKLFSTPVFHTDLPMPAIIMIQEQYNQAKEMIEADYKQNSWGDNITTTFDKVNENDAIGKYGLFGLLEFTRPVVKYFTELLYRDVDLYLYDSWINAQGKHQHQRAHTHPGCLISAVYYLQTNGKDGDISFHPPLSSMQINEPASDEWNYSMITYPPAVGRLFVFPSWVSHSVGDNMTDDVRVSVAMNFK